MSYQFPPELDELIKRHLASGEYENEDDLLIAAMRSLEQQKLARWEDRNRLAEEQSRLGLSKPLDDEHVLGRLRERLAQEGILD